MLEEYLTRDDNSEIEIEIKTDAYDNDNDSDNDDNDINDYKEQDEKKDETKDEILSKQLEFDKFRVLQSIIRILHAIEYNDPMYYSLDLFKLYGLFDAQSPVGTHSNFFNICDIYKILGMFGYKQLRYDQLPFSTDYMSYLNIFANNNNTNNNNNNKQDELNFTTTIFVREQSVRRRHQIIRFIRLIEEFCQRYGYQTIMKLSYTLSSTHIPPKESKLQYEVEF